MPGPYPIDPAAARRQAQSDVVSNMEIVRLTVFKVGALAAVRMVRITETERRIYLGSAPEFPKNDTPDIDSIRLHGRDFRRARFNHCQLLWEPAT